MKPLNKVAEITLFFWLMKIVAIAQNSNNNDAKEVKMNGTDTGKEIRKVQNN